MAGQPRELTTLLSDDDISNLYTALTTSDTDTFRRYYETHRLSPSDRIRGAPLLFIASGSIKTAQHFSFNIVDFLIQKGVDLNEMVPNMEAETLSAAYDTGWNQQGWFEDHVNTSVAMNLAVKGDLGNLSYIYYEGASFDLTTVVGETIFDLTQKQIEHLDNTIEWLNNLPPDTFTGMDINAVTKQRAKVGQVYRWLNQITLDRNIGYQVSRKNRQALSQVLKGAPVFKSDLERKYFMNFAPKPAKFAIQPTEIGLKHVNTTLFQGGTRRRKLSKATRKYKRSSK